MWAFRTHNYHRAGPGAVTPSQHCPQAWEDVCSRAASQIQAGDPHEMKPRALSVPACWDSPCVLAGSPAADILPKMQRLLGRRQPPLMPQMMIALCFQHQNRTHMELLYWLR